MSTSSFATIRPGWKRSRRRLERNRSSLDMLCKQCSIDRPVALIDFVFRYTEPEVAKQLLNDGQVLVGDMLVSVKEMEGQSSGKSISSPQVHNMLLFPPSAESVPHPPSPVQADMPEGGAAEKEGKCVADRDQRGFKSWSRKCVFDMKQFVRQEEGGQYSCILCDKIFSVSITF